MELCLLQNTTNLMRSNIYEQIENSSKYSDIAIIIENLFSLNELKLLCKNKLEQSNNKLRSLFINCSPIDTVLSKDLLVNILKYCQTKEYGKIPCLSKSFKKLMSTSTILYKDYKLELYIAYPTEYSLPLNLQKNLNASIYHSDRDIVLNLAEDGSTKLEFFSFPYQQITNIWIWISEYASGTITDCNPIIPDDIGKEIRTFLEANFKNVKVLTSNTINKCIPKFNKTLCLTLL